MANVCTPWPLGQLNGMVGSANLFIFSLENC